MILSQLQNEFVSLPHKKVPIEDFFVLVSHILSLPKTFLLAHPEYILSTSEEEAIRKSLERRLKDEPVAYITGQKEFFGRNFFVTNATLIPRPETELLVEAVLEHIKNTRQVSPLSIIDIGTGSGNIIVTLREEIKRRDTRYFGIDISKEALKIANENDALYKNETPITFIESDLLKNFNQSDLNGDIIIVANLPYLSQKIYDESENDVRNYEPKGALLSQDNGLDHYMRLLNEIKQMKRTDRSLALFFEISPEQSSQIKERVSAEFPEMTISILPDLRGKNRLMKAIN